ncbi:leucyl aminopeptidase [Desulfosarcina sp. OttesenSCG-928-A07]|nr:leucyl aminopeptidase [Desulfosarcina sp. OttesenSCG-928-G17]MDL2330234.1 leucyl aminopeptidase [Desulfosarcina sp. OttesenSCG-928-A07]
MLEVQSLPFGQIPVGTLVVLVCEDRMIHTDPAIVPLIEAATGVEEFNGKKDETLTLFHPDGALVRRAIFFGLGKAATLTGESFRAGAGKAMGALIRIGLSEAAIAVPDAVGDAVDSKTVLTGLMEGAVLANHVFDRYKAEKKKKTLSRVTFFCPADQEEIARVLADDIASVCGATLVARDWVNLPANDKPPFVFAQMIADTLASRGLVVDIKDEKWLAEAGFGAMLAVSQGSTQPPRLVTVDYHPENPTQTLVLVGKGVTFDSGGIDIKPASGMETMKTDMAGAAAVAATMMALGRLRPSMRVVGVMPLVENMPSGTATRPGDVVRAYSGTTIEIGNTDAEGRLILADAMAWAIDTWHPDLVIDLATLTGACAIALGESIAGVFSNHTALSDALVASGNTTRDRCWAMPLPDDYKELLKSEIADLSNMSSGRYGGAITAALFLASFVGDTPWAHIDIAGPARAQKAGAWCGSGGTGFGVRLLCDFILGLQEKPLLA